MTDVAAVNASPLIYLTGAGQLDLLRLAGDEVVVPRAVADEVGRWGADDPVARALDETPWLNVVPNPTRRGHCSSACENRACTSPTPCSIEPWR